MLKEAFEWIKEQGEAHLFHVGGSVFSDKHLQRIKNEPTCDSITLNSLDGILDYVRTGVDRNPDETYLLQVESPDCIRLYSELNSDMNRNLLAVANAYLPELRMDRYIDAESFVIYLRTGMKANADTETLIKVASNVIDEATVKTLDDGISQKTQMNTGVGTVADVIVPNQVNLSPFRTFREVDQPESPFIFRMKKDSVEVKFALFEADGGAWREEAVSRIEKYLKDALKDNEKCGNVHVLR